jgi:hypothetical protein
MPLSASNWRIRQFSTGATHDQGDFLRQLIHFQKHLAIVGQVPGAA